MGHPGRDSGHIRRTTTVAAAASFALVVAGWGTVGAMIDGDVVSAISVAHNRPAPPAASGTGAAAEESPGLETAGAVATDAGQMAAQFERAPCPSPTAGQIAFSAHLRSVAISIQSAGRSPRHRASFSGITVCHPANRVNVYRVDNPALDAAVGRIAKAGKVEVEFMPAEFSFADTEKVRAFITANRKAWSARGITIPAIVAQPDGTVEVAVTGLDEREALELFRPHLRQVRIVEEGAALAR